MAADQEFQELRSQVAFLYEYSALRMRPMWLRMKMRGSKTPI